MLKIQMTGRLVAALLRTGALHPRSTVLDGVPDGYVLTGASFDLGVLSLVFEHPTEGGELHQETKAVVVRSEMVVRSIEGDAPCTQN